eukprot:gene4308-6105_t
MKLELLLAVVLLTHYSNNLALAFGFGKATSSILGGWKEDGRYNNEFGNMKKLRSSGSPAALGNSVMEPTSDVEKYTAVPGLDLLIRPSITDKARTITHVCTSGTLCTTSVMEGVEGVPFGSYVDYILDEVGWPVLLLSDQSLHTQNIRMNPCVSLFCQLPRSQQSQTTAALSRVTVMGKIQPIEAEELPALKLAFTLIHRYSEQIVDSPKFAFFKIKPEKIYFSGGFGVMATWVNVEEYELARPDVLAQEVSIMLSKVNSEKQSELFLLCKHFLGLDIGNTGSESASSSANILAVTQVRVQAIDRLGVDLRVETGEFTDEYRIAFRHTVNSAEDAKSELVKLFQEAWECENGYFTYTNESAPKITKYAEDILRNKK